MKITISTGNFLSTLQVFTHSGILTIYEIDTWIPFLDKKLKHRKVKYLLSHTDRWDPRKLLSRAPALNSLTIPPKCNNHHLVGIHVMSQKNFFLNFTFIFDKLYKIPYKDFSLHLKRLLMTKPSKWNLKRKHLRINLRTLIWLHEQ